MENEEVEKVMVAATRALEQAGKLRDAFFGLVTNITDQAREMREDKPLRAALLFGACVKAAQEAGIVDENGAYNGPAND